MLPDSTPRETLLPLYETTQRTTQPPPHMPVHAEVQAEWVDDAEAAEWLAESAEAEEAAEAELEADDDAGVELAEDEESPIPLIKSRSLIPVDILEAIAKKEETATHHMQDAGDSIDMSSEVYSEEMPQADGEALLARTQVLRRFPAEALALLAEGAVRHHLTDRGLAFLEGDAADTFFVVEHGTMEAVRVSLESPEVALSHIEENQAFGLFGLLSRRMRCATLRSIGDAVVVEFSASRLDEVVRTHPSAKQALARFFKERLLENFMAVSPLFRNLDALGRAALISHFQDRRLTAGEVLLSPGEVQNGIYLVTSGRIVIQRRSGGGEQELAALERGKFFGVVSALSGTPTRASIVAQEQSTVCCLPQKSFNDFVKGYPVLRTLAARLQEVGTLVERDLFVGDATVIG
jgi:cAMP-dependent protein kinase regulator